jgi:hypothetical protein
LLLVGGGHVDHKPTVFFQLFLVDSGKVLDPDPHLQFPEQFCSLFRRGTCNNETIEQQTSGGLTITTVEYLFVDEPVEMGGLALLIVEVLQEDGVERLLIYCVIGEVDVEY